MAAVFGEEGGGGPDVILSACLAEPPAAVGRFSHATEDYLGYRIGPGGIFEYSPFCAVFNASGQPAASLPLGWTAAGLPVGVHLAGRFGADEVLIALCAEIERAAPWAGRRAPMAGPVAEGGANSAGQAGIRPLTMIKDQEPNGSAAE